MSDRAQRLVLWLLAITLVVGTGLALRYARGYRPLAGLNLGGPPLNPSDVAVRLNQVRVAGRERGLLSWTLEAGAVEVSRSEDRMVFTSGITFTKLRTPPRSGAVEAAADAAARKKKTPAWIVTAQRAEALTTRTYGGPAGGVAQDKFVFSGSPLRARVLKPSGAPAATLTGPAATGTYNDRLRTLGLSGGGIVGAVGGLKIEARQVDWTDAANHVRCTGPVRATHSRGDLQGTDLIVNLRTRAATLQNVEGHFRVDDYAEAEGILTR